MPSTIRRASIRRDLEVNIKIALAPRCAAGTLDEKARNAFLATMTDEVAALCLRNNYLQRLAHFAGRAGGLGGAADHRELIERLEARGLLDREVEFLPSDAVIDARARQRARADAAGAGGDPGLCQADALCRSAGLAGDRRRLSGGELYRYFPETLDETYPTGARNHRLRREVIATVLANAMINRGGPAFVERHGAATSANAGQVAMAYAAARDVYGLTELNDGIDALDGKVAGDVQLALYARGAQPRDRRPSGSCATRLGPKGWGRWSRGTAQGVAALRQLHGALLPARLRRPHSPLG